MLLINFRAGFYVEHLDITRFLYHHSGIWALIDNNFYVAAFFDTLYFLLPITYLILLYQKNNWNYLVAWVLVFYNLFYSVAVNASLESGIEPHYVFILMPILFTSRKELGYMYTYNFVRYCFLYIFLSAAIFKLVNGGAFHMEQLSGALIANHSSLLLINPEWWYSKFISFIIAHKQVGYGLFFTAVTLQLSFSVGFFTSKFDRILQFLFVGFLIMDLLLMRINYFQTGIFLCLLWKGTENINDVEIRGTKLKNNF